MRKSLFIATDRHNFFIRFASEIEEEQKGIECAVVNPDKHSLIETMGVCRPSQIIIDGLIPLVRRQELIREAREQNPSVTVLIYRVNGQDYSAEETPMLITGKQQIVTSYAVH